MTDERIEKVGGGASTTTASTLVARQAAIWVLYCTALRCPASLSTDTALAIDRGSPVCPLVQTNSTLKTHLLPPCSVFAHVSLRVEVLLEIAGGGGEEPVVEAAFRVDGVRRRFW